MKKYIGFVVCLIFIICITICANKMQSETEVTSEIIADYPAAIMVDGEIYLLQGMPMPAEIDDSAIIGYTKSYTDTFPKKDGETNFNRELNQPYARVENGIAILYENEWYLCIPVCSEIGMEVHNDTDQIIRIEEGNAQVKMGCSRNLADCQENLCKGDTVFVPAGTWHNIINVGRVPLKVSTIYAPSHHPAGTVHRTKADAEREY